MTTIEERNQNLMYLSQIAINGTIQYKIDKIADVHINGLPYFAVFRRYNSPYEIVVEYANGDTYLRKDETIRTTLQSILCISPEEASHMYTNTVYSYMYHTLMDTLEKDVADRYWSEIQPLYGAVMVDFYGILQDFQTVYDNYQESASYHESAPHTPIQKKKKRVVPMAPLRSAPKNEIIADNISTEPWSVLFPVWEIAYESQQEKQEPDTEYTVLRSGARLPKRQKGQNKQKGQKTTH